jgi:hypothetical protein
MKAARDQAKKEKETLGIHENCWRRELNREDEDNSLARERIRQ